MLGQLHKARQRGHARGIQNEQHVVAGRRDVAVRRRDHVQHTKADRVRHAYEALVHVERVDLNDAEEIVAICRRGRQRQLIPIVDLPLPSPAPVGWEWIEAYRHWVRGGR